MVDLYRFRSFKKRDTRNAKEGWRDGPPRPGCLAKLACLWVDRRLSFFRKDSLI